MNAQVEKNSFADTTGRRPLSRTNPHVLTNVVPGTVMADIKDLEAIPWVPYPHLPGIVVKYVWVDLMTGLSVVLARVAPGVQLPLHVHLGMTMIFLVKGKFSYPGAGSIGPGGFGFEPPMTVHEPDVMAEETIFYSVNNNYALLQVFNPDGSSGGVVHIVDHLREIRREHGEKAVAHLNLPAGIWELDDKP
jgi:hypothetical protein